jgi:hypothetical protein
VRTSPAVVAASSLVLAIGFGPSALGSSPVDGALGGYLLNAISQVRVSPFPASEQSSEVRVILERATTPGHVSVRLESRGYTCVLDAARSRSGDLEFSKPASCPVEVRRTDARGRIDAQLRSGQGKVRDGRLTLDLRFDVSGSISTRVSGRTFTLFQAEFTFPEGWTPAVPIRGTVTSGGSGARQGALP